MRQIGSAEDGTKRYHDSTRFETGEMWESLSGRTYVVTNLGKGDAVDEYGVRNSGFFYTLRPATAEELAQREAQRAEWNAKSPEERIDCHIQEIKEVAPRLDW